MIAVKEDGPARDFVMRKKLPGNGTLSGVAQTGKSQADIWAYSKRLRILALESITT